MTPLLTVSTPSRLQFLPDPFPDPVPIQLYLKRDDELHPAISGNKWRKLKYNLAEARRLGHQTLLTYGGAWSNHIYAVAAAGKEFGFSTIGVIRGQDHRERDTPTLAFARQQGMHLHFITRQQYRNPTDPVFQQELQLLFGPYYELPEGGTNELAIQGTAEIIPEILGQLDPWPDAVCCPVGTGGTLAGLERSAPDGVSILGFPALKGFVSDKHPRAQLVTAYHFGGYAKTTPDLLAFIRRFEQQTGVRLEQVYTGKMLYGIYDLARHGFFKPGAAVVALHTGGLQGRSEALDS
ncbi:1-aminocyclopropane-1-carboxylate deaminase/D-cysteine desulfhydrase-like pyridoxal-dependent ACC family enzyme [Larkinella arboricola]|uniref:1-aminocyclopropane-1-carboxylate deaminase/D-cysteine desulfhydrase-like pyridoxal-dependent ACC family enzyme n=1 Tax=Larkinella arboricola TaxID=643671 RepID=A0A327X0S7_LARAB|nr:pyridoxal-phosphate dependent enzyme [Larkinella arboricola]RAK00071.1 1-aminocyclopropane-1-carboxylate deaminase/D-cysteine desulfhydrase-like pyridoxal-dependent ACC family enzyme [Larkinella arboricola]